MRSIRIYCGRVDTTAYRHGFHHHRCEITRTVRCSTYDIVGVIVHTQRRQVCGGMYGEKPRRKQRTSYFCHSMPNINKTTHNTLKHTPYLIARHKIQYRLERSLDEVSPWIVCAPSHTVQKLFPPSKHTHWQRVNLRYNDEKLFESCLTEQSSIVLIVADHEIEFTCELCNIGRLCE